ncbi:MAG: hypothetical protein ABIQ31_05425 [Ferruginibacter sp.]
MFLLASKHLNGALATDAINRWASTIGIQACLPAGVYRITNLAPIVT